MLAGEERSACYLGQGPHAWKDAEEVCVESCEGKQRAESSWSEIGARFYSRDGGVVSICGDAGGVYVHVDVLYRR